MIPSVWMELWIVWKGTSCTKWDSGCLGKVRGVWSGFVESHARIS
jgi:hypothetical protein